MALAASSSFGISTKPKPRDLPVSRSIAMCTRATWPNGSKIARRSPSVVWKLMFPTNKFFMPISFTPGQTSTDTSTAGPRDCPESRSEAGAGRTQALGDPKDTSNPGVCSPKLILIISHKPGRFEPREMLVESDRAPHKVQVLDRQNHL